MTIVSLLDGGFRILKERAGALLIWTLIQLAATIAASFALAGILAGNLDALAYGASAESVQATYLLQSFLVGLAGLVVTTILYAAAQRVVIYPMEGGPGWLKLGKDEVRLFLLFLAYVVVFTILYLVAGLFLGALLIGGGRELLQLVLILLAIVAGGYFGTRLSLTFPLTLKRRAFAISEGWNLTKGHGWTLFAAYLIIFLMLFLVGILTTLVTEPGYISAVFQHGFGAPETEQASLHQFEQLMRGEIDAPIIIGWVLTAIQGAVGYALLGGAAATAVQQLTADEEGLVETFS